MGAFPVVGATYELRDPVLNDVSLWAVTVWARPDHIVTVDGWQAGWSVWDARVTRDAGGRAVGFERPIDMGVYTGTDTVAGAIEAAYGLEPLDRVVVIALDADRLVPERGQDLNLAWLMHALDHVPGLD